MSTDCILALRVLVERRRKFRQGILALCVNLKNAFDLMHMEAIWDFIRLRGIFANIINL